MKRFLTVLLWTAVFLLTLLATDRLLVRVPASHPAHVAVTDFYRDLRSRVIDLVKGTKPAAPAKPTPPRPPASVERIIEPHQASPPAPLSPAAPARPMPAAPPAEPAPRYVYADVDGELHFAATLAEIPEPYREKARLLGE